MTTIVNLSAMKLSAKPVIINIILIMKYYLYCFEKFYETKIVFNDRQVNPFTRAYRPFMKYLRVAMFIYVDNNNNNNNNNSLVFD